MTQTKTKRADRPLVQEQPGRGIVPAGRGEAYLFSHFRPRGYWDVIGMHFPLAALTGLCLAVSLAVRPERIPFRVCSFLRLTGYPCPFCGFTRAFHATATGDWTGAITNCPLGFVTFFGVAAVFAWHAAALLTGHRLIRGKLFRPSGWWRNLLLAVALLLVLANWGYRLAHGFS